MTELCHDMTQRGYLPSKSGIRKDIQFTDPAAPLASIPPTQQVFKEHGSKLCKLIFDTRRV